MVVDAAAISIAESAPLLMTPGAGAKTASLRPSIGAIGNSTSQGLAEAGRAAYRRRRRGIRRR
jgi:hypothetical protein